jgi:deoxyribodipyrimidine photo-lyase
MENVLFWHRRDLRIDDNAGLFRALKSGGKVIPLFVFDETILNKLHSADQRVIFIHQTIESLKAEYRKLGSDLQVYYGNPIEIIPEIASKFEAKTVFTNRDYEPLAITRDKNILDQLTKLNIEFKGSKDHVIFEKNEVLKPDDKPYTIFTPYMRKWKEKLSAFYLKSYPTEKYAQNLTDIQAENKIPTLLSMGFDGIQTVEFPSTKIAQKIIQNYHETRDIPSVLGTTRLSLHLRFGTISIRKLAGVASETNEKFFNELIWRDFYQMIIFHFPYSGSDAFKKDYDRIIWRNDEKQFKSWCEGKTGYPLVDAGMRELNATGFMHNRVRMLVASFLTKHLLIDWRWGASYFAEKLLDFELASNAGGWQWAAGCGCDAAPYFRVFSPDLQLEKFDKQLIYTKKWVPELGTDAYPKPIVDHKIARVLAVETYKKYLNATE